LARDSTGSAMAFSTFSGYGMDLRSLTRSSWPLLLLAIVLVVPEVGGAADVDVDVLIIGLGPVGMILSHLLSAYGVRNTMAIEKTNKLYIGPRAVAWDDYTIRTSRSISEETESWMRWHARLFADQWALACVGLKSGPAAARTGACDSYDAQARWRMNAMVSTRQPSVYFHQPTWEGWLRDGLSNLSLDVSLSTEVLETAIVDGICQVTVRSSSNGDGASEERPNKTIRARYCVATDGASSRTRRQLGLSYEGQTFPDQPWLVVDTEVHDVEYLKTAWIGHEGSGFIMNPTCPLVYILTPAFFGEWWAEADAEAAAQTESPKGSAAFRQHRDEALHRMAAVRLPKVKPEGNQTKSDDTDTPLVPPGTHFRFEFLVPGNMSEEEATSDANVGQLLRTCAEVDPRFLEIKRVVVYTFHARRAEKWRLGPVLLAGDAAHCMPPFQGQGMNSGIRDAANMAWKLSLILRGIADDAILDSYEPERLTNLQQVTDASVLLGRIVMVENPLLAYVRDVTFTFGNWLRSTFPFLDGIQTVIFVEPPHILSEASLLAQGYDQQVAGRLLPCPDVWLRDDPSMPQPLDKLVAPNGFTIILVSGPGVDPLKTVLKASARSLDFLRLLGASSLAVAPFDESTSGSGDALKGAVEASVVVGLGGGGRCIDSSGRWTAWVKRYKLEGRLLLVRPDRYIFGAFADVDSAVLRLSQLLRSPGAPPGAEPQLVGGGEL